MIWPVHRGWKRSSSPRSRRKPRRSGSTYLDQACGADAALRFRVERLLEAHPQAKDFLAQPAVDRDQFDSDEKKAVRGLRRVSSTHEAGGDAALRLQVERLLEAHPQAMDFLAQPAVDRDEFDARHATEDRRVLLHERPGSKPARSRGGDRADRDARPRARRRCGECPEFLQPSEKPGSLGRLGHYEVLEVLGKGGFGIVVRAFDEKLHRVVAIKVLAPLLAATSAAAQAVPARGPVGRGRPARERGRHLRGRGAAAPLPGDGVTSPARPSSRSSTRPARSSCRRCCGSAGRSPTGWPRPTRRA